MTVARYHRDDCDQYNDRQSNLCSRRTGAAPLHSGLSMLFSIRTRNTEVPMPILRVSLWTGRTKKQKAALAKALTDTMVDVAKVPPQAVTIQFDEMPKENLATGGKLHTELFKG